jgi:cytochrome c oxidase assembly protein subunit 15
MNSLYNFAPTLHLLILGALVASVPLGWMWLRQSSASNSQRVVWFTQLTLFITFDLVCICERLVKGLLIFYEIHEA